MRWIKRVTCFFLIYFMAFGLCAKEVSAVVKLANIKVQKPSEKGGDELYLNVTYYSSLGHSKNDRIPVSPAHWLSEHLDKVKDVTLWTGTLKEGEEVKLILSVVEEDTKPWDPDDLIGGAQLVLKNQKGKLTKAWSAPVFEEKVELEMKKPANPQEFIFKGDGSLYEVAFGVEHK